MALLAKLSPLVAVAGFALMEMLGAISWSSTITLGSIIVGVLVGVAGLATFAYGVRWKTAYETEKARGDSLEDGRRAFEMRGDRLENELKDCQGREVLLQSQMVETKAKLAALEALPDLSQVLQTLGEQSVREDAAADIRTTQAVEAVTERLATHDEQAAERQKEIIVLAGGIKEGQAQMLRALEMIADRLSPG